MAHKKQKRGPLQFLQFGTIGFVNAAIDIGTLNILLVIFSTDNWMLLFLFNSIAYMLAVGNSYFWNSNITFKQSAKGNNQQRLLFVIQGLISLGISNLVFVSASELLKFTNVPDWLRFNVSKGLAMLLSFLASFFMVKYFVFKDNEKHR